MKLTQSLLFLLFICLNLKAQYGEETFSIPKRTDFIIPPSPSMQMLDGGTSLVNSPGVVREFKVDWSFRTYRLAPNLAIEMQPIWTIFYNRPTLDKYQKAPTFLQTLSTGSFSVATLDANDSIRLFSYAGKMTVYREFDPLASSEWFKDIAADYEYQKNDIADRISNMEKEITNATDRFRKDSLEMAISTSKDELTQLKYNQKERIKERQQSLKDKYWNSSFIDIALGRSYYFNKAVNDRIDSVRLKKKGVSVWLNGSFGIGRHWLVTGLARWDWENISLPDSGKVKKQEIFIDDFTGDTTIFEFDSVFVNFTEIQESIFSIGVNIRFGTPRFTFFTEFFYSKSEIPTYDETKWQNADFDGTPGRQRVADIQREFNLAFGGEWRISHSLLLSFGVRTIIDQNFTFRSVLPLATITCLMR